jgi:hypothetical protein
MENAATSEELMAARASTRYKGSGRLSALRENSPMLNDLEESISARAAVQGAQLGLASLLLGGFLAIMAVPLKLNSSQLIVARR